MFYDYMKGLHPLRIWSNFLARMLHQKPRSLSGLMNLEEASRVSMMSTSAAHQRLLLWLQISRQQKNESEPNQRLPLKRFRKVIASERQQPCPHCTIIFVSENNVQGVSPTHWHATNDGVGFSGASLCYKSSIEAVQNWPKKCWQVTKLGSIDMIRKPRCSQRFGCFQKSPHPKKSCSAQKEMVACFYEKSGPLATIPLEDRRTVTVDW